MQDRMQSLLGLDGTALHEVARQRGRDLAGSRWEAAVCLLAVERKGIHFEHECSSVSQYAERFLRIEAYVAAEMLRVAKALEYLPELSEAFRTGEISWTSIREITRRAEASTDVEWAGIGKRLSTAEIQRLCVRSPRAWEREQKLEVQRRSGEQPDLFASAADRGAQSVPGAPLGTHEAARAAGEDWDSARGVAVGDAAATGRTPCADAAEPGWAACADADAGARIVVAYTAVPGRTTRADAEVTRGLGAEAAVPGPTVRADADAAEWKVGIDAEVPARARWAVAGVDTSVSTVAAPSLACALSAAAALPRVETSGVVSAPAETLPQAAAALPAKPVTLPGGEQPRIGLEFRLTPELYDLYKALERKIRGSHRGSMTREMLFEEICRMALSGNGKKTRTRTIVVLHYDPQTEAAWSETDRGVVPVAREVIEAAMETGRVVVAPADPGHMDVPSPPEAAAVSSPATVTSAQKSGATPARPQTSTPSSEDVAEPAKGDTCSSPAKRRRPRARGRRRLSAATMTALYARSNGRCERCGRSSYLHVHHCTPTSRGGTDDLEAVLLVCSGCHGVSHRRDFDEDPAWSAARERRRTRDSGGTDRSMAEAVVT